MEKKRIFKLSCDYFDYKNIVFPDITGATEFINAEASDSLNERDGMDAVIQWAIDVAYMTQEELDALPEFEQ